MNLLKKIFNIAPMGSTLGIPDTPAPMERTAGGGVHSEGQSIPLDKLTEASAALQKLYPRPAPAHSDDPFVVKWGHLRGLMNPIPPQMLEEIIRRGDLADLKEKTLAALAPIWKREKEILAEITNLTNESVNLRLHRLHAENESAIAKGDHEAIQIVPTRDRELELIGEERAKCRAQLRAVATQAHPILKRYADKLEEAAREVAEQLEAEEKTRNEAWGVINPHSSQLLTIAWLGLEGFANLGNHLGPTVTRLPSIL